MLKTVVLLDNCMEIESEWIFVKKNIRNLKRTAFIWKMISSFLLLKKKVCNVTFDQFNAAL